MEEIRIPKKLEKPAVDAEAWVAPGAVLAGRITIRRGASIWYNCVLRSDLEGAEIVVGEDSNIQDGAVVHVDENLSCRIGARVTVGHGAVLHATDVGDDCLIGMGAVVLSGSKIGRGAVIAAAALVPEGMEVPPGVIAAGVPAKVRRELTEEDRIKLERGWKTYAKLRDLHRKIRK